MNPHPLADSWRRTGAHLEAAADLLPDGPELDVYREYRDHNELGLAFDELVYAAEEAEASAAWPHLDAAAREMNLYSPDSPHARTAERCRRRARATD